MFCAITLTVKARQYWRVRPLGKMACLALLKVVCSTECRCIKDAAHPTKDRLGSGLILSNNTGPQGVCQVMKNII